MARLDITPPVGINARMWGCAIHDVAEGIHRPLTATVLTVRPPDENRPLVLASLDLGWWRAPEDEWFLRGPILREFSLDESQLLMHLTHTHAGPSISLQAKHKPGGDKVEPYLRAVQQAVISAIREALATARRATLTWNTGRCSLAAHRAQKNPEGNGTIVGYAPEVEADDTLLVGRVTDASQKTLATLVNYACHPTTLGWKNRLISPDYVGAMRETVEQATEAAPCLFLGGAAGDLAPRRHYVAQTDVADQNGRQLGYAVLATLADMLPHQMALRFDRIKESTTLLGCWELVARTPETTWNARRLELELPSRPLPQPEELIQLLETCDDRASAERIERMAHLYHNFQGSENAVFPIWLWRLGGAVLVGTPAEMHSPFQVELRQRFADHAVVVLNIVNGTYGYLPPLADYSLDTYECKTSLFERGAHETVLATCRDAIDRLIAEKPVDEVPLSRPPHFTKRKGVPSAKRPRR